MDQDKLSNWLDSILKESIPENVIAFGFNLYEDEDNHWSIELVGTNRFDIEDEDWCCDEITDFGTRENSFTWKQDTTWNKILEDVISYLKEYLNIGKYANVLKDKMGIGVGFVDGDLEIIYHQ